MTLAEQWKQEGINIGFKQGFEEGYEKGFEKGFEEGFEEGFKQVIEQSKKQGKLIMISKQLTLKFREEAQHWISKLNSLSTDEIELITERILTAENAADVFEGIWK